MKLKEGMYVRTKAGMIAKIVSKEDVSGSLHREEVVFILDNGNRLALHSRKVVKASHNIIDLIEVGDYVNGFCVIESSIGLGEIACIEDIEVLNSCNNYKGDEWVIPNIFYKLEDLDIKSIVTKEQFESMSYKVEK